jgi:uncharacterized RDD family membrane protein YckC
MISMLYPGLVDRIKAVLFDVCILIAMMFVATSVLSAFENVPEAFRIGIFLFVFIVYDPLLTSVNGATLGHMIVGICVRRASDETKKISFIMAILRYIVKASLGWISLLTVAGNERRKAIHDMFVNSVVVYKNAPVMTSSSNIESPVENDLVEEESQ